jgi:flagellar hook-associated protein 2
MAGIKIGGLASGLPPNLVEQVIEAERQPVKIMQESKAKIEDKVKLVGDFETKVNDITTSMSSLIGRRGFVDKQLISGFPDIISGTLDPEIAEPGEWTLEVEQLARKPSVVSNGFPDKNETTIGVGYIRFNTADGGQKEVYFSNENSTLEKLAATINNAGVGVVATVVNDRSDKEDSYKIELSGEKTGDDYEIEYPVVYALDGDRDFQFVENNKAVNAKFKLDGHEFETASNEISDLLPGVVLDLKQAKPGQPVRIDISENYDKISDKMKSFVESYNAALAFIQGQNKLVDGKNGLQRLGPLGGDSMLRLTQGRMQSIIQDAQMTDSDIKRIIELGVEFNRQGTLTFNQDKFKKILTEDPKRVVKFLRGNLVDVGFIPNLTNKLKNLTTSGTGVISSRKKNFQDRANQVDQRIDRKEKSLEKREEQLRRQFSKMEETMAKINSQAGALSGMGKG